MAAANVLTVNVKLNADGSMLINGVKKSREEVEAFAKSSTTAKDKVKEFGDSTAAMGSKVTDFGKSVAGLVVSLAAAGGALYKVAQAGIEFETKISQLAVITGATGNDLDLLKTKAISLGNELGRTGSAFAEAAAVMGSQRPELLKMPAILAETTAQAIILAKAANAMGIAMSDADAAKYLGGTLNQFGLDASNAARVINVFTASAKEGSALIGDVAESMRQAGGALANANISVEESAGLIETLAKFNIVGSEAGVATRNFINILGASADKLAALGIAASEVNPQVVGLQNTLKRLEEANLSAADVTYLFGMENANAATRLIQNRSEVERFTKAVTGTNAAYDAAKDGSQTLDAQWKSLTARVTNLAVGIYENFEPALKSVMSTINTAVEVFTGLAVQLGLVNQSFTGVANKSTAANAAISTFSDLKTVFSGFADDFKPVFETFENTGVIFRHLKADVMGFFSDFSNQGSSIIAFGGFLREVFINAQIGAIKFFSYIDIAKEALSVGWMGIKQNLSNIWLDSQIAALNFFRKIDELIGSAKIAFGSMQDSFVLGLKKMIDGITLSGVGESFRAVGGAAGDIVASLEKARDGLNQYSDAEKSAKKASNANLEIYDQTIAAIEAQKDAYKSEIQASFEAMGYSAQAAEESIAALEKKKEAVFAHTAALQQAKNIQLDQQNALQESSKIGIQQAQMLAEQTAVFGEEAQKATIEALAYAGAVQKVAESQKKAAETNKGASIGKSTEYREKLNIELVTLPFENELDKELAKLRKLLAEDRKLGDSAITQSKMEQTLAENEAKAQNIFLEKQGLEIGKERLKVYQNGNILQTLKDEYDRITFLTEAQRNYLVQEKASIEVLKLKNQIQESISKAGLSEEQARVNDLMKQYSGIISETTAKNIASIEKQSKGYTELRGSYDKLQVASVISEQNELISLSNKYGESIAKQIFDINNLAKARQDANNAQKDVQLAGLTGVQKEVATTAIKYGGDVEAAKQVVGLQRQKAATEELVNAQKELKNASLTEDQRKYLDLAEKIGAANAKQALEMRNLAEARKAGVAELQKSVEELRTINLSDKAKGYYDVIKNVAPEYREQILALKQQTAEIQKQQGIYNDLANAIADQFALIGTGQKSVSQGWKDMANDVGSMLQKISADAMKQNIMQAFGANNPQQDAMAAIKAAQQADADRAKQFQVSIQEVDLSVKKTIEERSIDASSKMGSTISEGVTKLQTSLETALSNLNQSMPKAIESFGKQMSDAISSIKIPATQQEQMLKAQMAGFDSGNLALNNDADVKTKATQIAQFFMDKLSITAEQASGIVGNFMRESKLNSRINEGGAVGDPRFKGGYGLAQWTGVRQRDLDTYAKSQGADTGDLLTQLNFTVKELQSNESRALQKLKESNTAGEAAAAFEKFYERAGVKAVAERQREAEKVFSSLTKTTETANNSLSNFSQEQANATVSAKAVASAQTDQSNVFKQSVATQQEVKQTQAQMLDEQNKAFMESSQAAIKAAESVGVLGLESIKGSNMIASGAQLAAAKIMNIADARVNAIYNMKATGADPDVIKKIIGANSIGNASGVEGVIKGSAQDKALAAQMEGFDTSATGFFGELGSGLKGVVSSVQGWIGTAKSTVSGWVSDLGLSGFDLGGATQWAGTVGSLLKGDIKGAVTSGLSVGANLLGTAIAGPIGGIVAGFAANALTGLAMGGGETRGGGLYEVNQKLAFSKIQGPSGGDIGGKEGFNKVSEAMTGTVKQINGLLEKLGSKAQVIDFKAALETSDKNRGGVYSGGKLSTGQAFGEQFHGQNVFESQTSRTLNAEQATKAFQLDLMQATLQAIQVATDVPKFVSSILKDIDIEALDEKGVTALLTTIESINAMGDAMQNLGFSTDSITQSMIESAGGIESFKTNMSVFTDKFANDQDKTFAALNNATSDLEKNLSALGGAIPQSRDSLVDMVKGLDLTSEAGQQAFGSLMKLMPALDQYYSIQENAVDKYFEVFGTAQQKAARSQEKLTEQFDKFGLQVPQSETAFQGLVEQLYAGDQASKNQAIALMNLYPQWKANQDAQNSMSNSLSGFTANLKAMASSINEQTVSSNLSKAVTDAKSPQEAGNNFATAMMQSIQQTMVSTLIQSISQAVLTGLVQPMMTGASNAAMMQAQGGSIAGMNMAQGGTMAATANAQGGSMAATNVAIGGQNAANAMTMGGSAAANALSAGGQSAAERVQAVIAQAREMMSTMTAVMKDEGMQAAMSEMMDGFKIIGAETYTAVGTINQSFAQFTPAATSFSNEVSNAGSSASEAGGEAAQAAVDFTKFKDSLKDFSTGLEGDDLKMSKIQAAFKDVDLSSLNLSGSLENMASQIADLPDDKLKELAASAHLSVDDMQSYILDFFNISRQRAKEALDAYKSLQTGIKPQDKITEISTKYGVNPLESTFKDSKSYFEMLGKLSQKDLETIAAANHVTVGVLAQDALDYGNALKENEQKFKDFTKSLNDFSVTDKNQQTLNDLSAKYGQQINMTSAEYLKFAKGLKPEDIAAIAATYGISVDEVQKDLLDGANALQSFENSFKDFTKSFNDLSNFEPDQNKKILSDLSAKYGQQINMTNAEYIKFVKGLKPEDIAAIAATYGISVDEVQKDLLDAGGALKSLAETARNDAIEGFKAAIGAIDNSISSVKGGIEELNGLSAEQILAKTKQDWEKIVSSGQNLDQLTDATDKYKTAIDNVRQNQLKAIEDYRAGINKAIEDSQSFKKTLESDIFNLRKTLGKSGTSNADQMGLVQKQLSGITGKSQADLQKQTELQGRLKDLILGNLDDQINAQQKAFESQQKVFDAQKQQFETQLESSKALIGYAKDLKGFVDGLMLGDTSILTNEQRVNESQRQYQELLTKAKSGDQDAIKGLSNAASTYLKEAHNYFASSDTYTGIFKDVTSTVSGLAGSLERQGNAGVASNQNALNGLTEPTATQTGSPEIKSLQENALAQLMVLETARQQTETDLKALLTQPPPQAIEQTQFDSVIATVNDAALASLEGMQSSLESLGNQTVDSFGVNIAKLSADMGMNTAQTVAAIQGMQADFGGRLSAIVGVVQQAQADAAAAQARIAQMQAAQASINAGSVTTTGSFDLNSVMPSYDVGTPYVAGDQVAQIHDGEMVIDPQSANVLRKYGISIPQLPTQNTATVDNKELIELVKQNNNLLMRLIELISNLENNSTDQVALLAILNELLPREIVRGLEKLKPRASAK